MPKTKHRPCDCLNVCGDDPDLHKGNVDYCEAHQRAVEAQQQRLDAMPKVAYEAYCNTTDWKSAATGAALPSYDKLPDTIKEAWTASARAVMEETGYRGLS